MFHHGLIFRFHLYKENKDTQEALGLIGRMLGVQAKSLGFAGTKDKRAVSTQRVTVFKQHASKLAALNDRLIGIKVGDFCYVDVGLSLGQLKGNRFTITLRSVSDSEAVIKSSVDSLEKHGFINYFGLQRFGSGSVPTHLIGAALLRGEWKNAVSMILDPRDGERDAVKKAREYYVKNDDINGTLKQLPSYLVAERSILQCLKNNPGNFLQALKAIPRTLRMMYIHSYQSYLWNHAASERVRKYGHDQVVLGDLVYCQGDDGDDEIFDVISKPNDDVREEHCDLCHGKNIVKVITKEDIFTGKYTIDDIILPMPGSQVTYPTHDVTEIYHGLAMLDGISLTESTHNVKEFSITSLTGSYRHVIQKPMQFEWELFPYSDDDHSKSLAETDMDKILKVERTKRDPLIDPKGCDLLQRTDDNVADDNVADDNVADDNVADDVREVAEQACDLPNLKSPQLALRLRFTLPASCYATMAIRELLKTSTSVTFHRKLSQL